ncbi:hypothetical protein GGX14DRAFT_430690 [Mycena pura]|uniref:DUF4211 domain-containing protein n=1 Tax=Mycena pura TaxID=153505 RepID=A0AAD6VTU3_9AGAR|nr:hypothetical protein GGX14DRAFT_430690 [Mycena pura]
MVRAKRKASAANADKGTGASSPPKKRARVARLASDESGAESDLQVVAHKARRRPKRVEVGSEEENPPVEDTPAPNVVKKVRRTKPKTPPPIARNSADPESDASGLAAAPRKRQTRVKVELLSDSDADEERPKKRLRRIKLPAEDVGESDPGTSSPRKSRLRRKSEEKESSAPSKGWVLDSDDDPEDLALPVQSTSSKPSKKEHMAGALERYAKARKNKTSPATAPVDVKREEDNREFTPIPEVDDDDDDDDDDEAGDDEAGDEEEQDNGEDFIAEDEEDADATTALDRMRYSHREFEDHFAVFVEYIVALNSDPNYLSTVTDNEKEYFETAIMALRRHFEPLADSMAHSTWKAPFMATLKLRPVLADGISCDRSYNCHACWTRGRYSCDISGSIILSTKKGTYDSKTFQNKSEKDIKFGKKTSFENNAEARNLPYPPRFELVIGQRCFDRALAYHDAWHYMYNLSARVKEKIQSLSENDEDLADDPNALLQALKDENFIDYLWERFKSDKNHWAHFANRKDRDALT